MRKIRNIIIVLIIFVIVILLILQLSKKTDTSTINNNSENNYEITDVPRDENLNQETNIITLHTLQEYTKKYIKFVNENDLEAIQSLAMDNNLNNLEYTKINYNSNNYYIQEAYTSQTSNNGIYYTYGISINNSGDMQNNYFTIYLDYQKETFAIADSSEQEFEDARNQKAQKISAYTINKNDNNAYIEGSMEINERVRIYLDDFYFKLSNKPEMAFDLLDDNYRESKFNDISEFISYINTNKEKILNFDVYETGYNYIDNHLQYKCTSTSKLVYIIDAYGGLNYRIQLDNYTVEDTNWKEIYSNAKDQEKVTLIINKVLDMINQKDYNALYNIINYEFKQKNFPTEQSFENYMKEHFFETNVLNKLSMEEKSGMHICTCEIKETNKVASDKVTQEFVILLKEGTDFDISFKIK